MSAEAPKYRPSNATEGDAFAEKWCATCGRTRAFFAGDEDEPCRIIGAAMFYDVDDPEYPPELVGTGLDDARCTAWHSDEDAPTPRCPDTADMFEEGTP